MLRVLAAAILVGLVRSVVLANMPDQASSSPSYFFPRSVVEPVQEVVVMLRFKVPSARSGQFFLAQSTHKRFAHSIGLVATVVFKLRKALQWAAVLDSVLQFLDDF